MKTTTRNRAGWSLVFGFIQFGVPAIASAQTASAAATAPYEFDFHPLAFAVAIIVILALYSAAAVATSGNNRHKQSRWNPLVITAGQFGRGSLSRLQVFYFTLIVAGSLTYILVKTAKLSGMSGDVLMLLGISAVGAAGSQVVAITRKRLSSENWSWLMRKAWIRESIEPESQPASARDLVTSGKHFDIYKFQMLTFSLIVGGALVAAAFNNVESLAEFKIPEAMLGALGLSHVVYLGGKASGAPVNQNLNTLLDEVRRLEQVFVKAVVAKWADTPPAPGDVDTQDKKMSVAIAAAVAEYNEYMAAAENAARVVNDLTGNQIELKRIEPSLLPKVPGSTSSDPSDASAGDANSRV